MNISTLFQSLYLSAFYRSALGFFIFIVATSQVSIANDSVTLTKQPKPLSQSKYLGVASCSSSNCHGAVAPRNATNVLQNEYTTWSKHDAHAKAWLTLLNEDSKKIAAHLGISKPEEEPLCITCHATYVSSSNLKGEKFRLEDGVSCESCHGPAERYIGPHAEEGASRKQNLELGMLDLVNTGQRAKFCLGCHLGNDEKTVDHRLIGAGHPRLTFELDTFTALQPVHWDIDTDYKSRKEDYIPAKAWLIGQIERAEQLLEAMLSPTRSRVGTGLLESPELSLLYCFTCHHSLTEQQWKNRSYGGSPGELRLNLSSFLILENALKITNQSLSQTLSSHLEALHSGNSNGVSKDLRNLLQSARVSVNEISFGQSTINNLIRSMATFGASSRNSRQYPPFEVAEQVAMALSSLASTVKADGTYLRREIDLIYSSLSSPEEFKPDLFVSACEQLLLKL